MSVMSVKKQRSVKRILWIRIARHFMILALSVTMIFISLAHCSNTVRRILAVSIICKTSSWNILRPKLVKSEVGLHLFVFKSCSPKPLIHTIVPKLSSFVISNQLFNGMSLLSTNICMSCLIINVLLIQLNIEILFVNGEFI